MGLSGLITVLHALSDVTVSSSSKLPSGLAIFSAYAFGFALWGILEAMAVENTSTLPLPTLLASIDSVTVVSSVPVIPGFSVVLILPHCL
jgi:hypothetical protein